MPTRPASWRTIRNRYNAITRELQARAAAQRPDAPAAVPHTPRRPKRVARPAPKPRTPTPAGATAPCGHPTVAACAAGWNGFQRCPECERLLAKDPSCGGIAACALPGFPPCDAW